MHMNAAVRAALKGVPPLYWLVGLNRYRAFRKALREEERRYAAEAMPTTPPPLLRYRVHRALDETSYVAVGTATAATLADFLRRHSIDANGASVLDFGCGPGRVARWFKQQFPLARLQGSDIDAEAIAWARDHLAEIGRFEVNRFEPPTGHADGAFDIVYCVSLFTHLDEALQDRWLAELRRIIRPGGHLVATTHGRHALHSCTPAELQAIERTGIAFRVDRKGRFKLDGLPDFYQTTFHERGYVARHWSRFFELVSHDEGGLHGHHDLVLLRKPMD